MKFKFTKEEDRWKDNPLAQMLIFAPAAIISQLLVLPFVIIALPLTIFSNTIQLIGMRFFLRLQHTISLSFWYFLAEYYYPDLLPLPFWIESIFVLVGVYIGFNKIINDLVNETLIKQGFM